MGPGVWWASTWSSNGFGLAWFRTRSWIAISQDLRNIVDVYSIPPFAVGHKAVGIWAIQQWGPELRTLFRQLDVQPLGQLRDVQGLQVEFIQRSAYKRTVRAHS